MEFYRKRSFLGLVVCLMFFAGCVSTPPAPVPYRGPISVVGSSGAAVPHTLYHTIGPSETLWRISKTYGVDMNELMRVNGITDAKKINNGQELVIPNTLGAKPVVPLYPTKRWTHIVIHHTATHQGDAYSIDQLHQRRGFWNGLGYHFLINNGTNGKEDGQIQVGPRWIKQMDGAHANAAGMNEKGIGIVLVGNFSEKKLSQKELDSLVFLVKTLQNFYRIPSRNVIRHSEVPGKHTECPGTQFPWAEFKRQI